MNKHRDLGMRQNKFYIRDKLRVLKRKKLLLLEILQMMKNFSRNGVKTVYSNDSFIKGKQTLLKNEINKEAVL